jgi:arsenite methyltransferase
MPDRWATWLAERRFGGNEDARRESQAMFDEFRRRVLEGARIHPGDTVVDVGCGEGLIGFGALELVGDDGAVVFSDISEDVLDVCREIAHGDHAASSSWLPPTTCLSWMSPRTSS